VVGEVGTRREGGMDQRHWDGCLDGEKVGLVLLRRRLQIVNLWIRVEPLKFLQSTHFSTVEATDDSNSLITGKKGIVVLCHPLDTRCTENFVHRCSLEFEDSARGIRHTVVVQTYSV